MIRKIRCLWAGHVFAINYAMTKGHCLECGRPAEKFLRKEGKIV